MIPHTTPHRPAALAALLLFAAVALAYWPGLHGGFLFDDYANLDALGRYGGVRDLHTFLYFLTSGEADPTGRPLAQLSFRLDARDWPADPLPFKSSNLLLHLLNGALLLLLLRRLETQLAALHPGAAPRGGHWIALLAAALWLAHPLWVSTTLYVIQRQAMLAATGCLLGLLALDRCWLHWQAGRRGRGWTWGVLGVGGATLLAGLGKANGFLTPLLALLLWWVLYLPQAAALPAARGARVRRDGWLLLGPAALAIVAYILAQVPSAMRRSAAIRGWDLSERLLSQPRALMDYLGLLLVPREGSGGVFNDGFAVSHGLLDPATTLPALLGVLALLALGLAVRRSLPRLSGALLFFFAGHVMESGPLPLELYFEHRNYLPALLLFWPLAALLLAPGAAARLRTALAALLVAAWLLLAWQRAAVWGDQTLQAVLWAQRNPQSPRAQGYAADMLAQAGRNAEAQALLQGAAQRMPGQVEIALNRIAEGCATGRLSAADLAAAAVALGRHQRWNQGMQQWLLRMDDAVLRGDCPALGTPGLARLLDAVQANPAYSRSPSRRQALLRLRGRNVLAAGDAPRALQLYDRALDLDPRPTSALAMAADLGNAGHPALGLRHLDHYAALDVQYAPRHIRSMADVHRWLLLRTGYYRHEIDVLRKALRAAAEGR